MASVLVLRVYEGIRKTGNLVSMICIWMLIISNLKKIILCKQTSAFTILGQCVIFFFLQCWKKTRFNKLCKYWFSLISDVASMFKYMYMSLLLCVYALHIFRTLLITFDIIWNKPFRHVTMQDMHVYNCIKIFVKSILLYPF